MNNVLERRYGHLLRSYPAADRSRFGDELVGTLLESARPGQRWPDPRQAFALVLAGLRARTLAERRGGRAMRAQGFQVAVLGLLMYSVAAGGFEQWLRFRYDGSTRPLLFAWLTLTVLAVPFALRGRFLIAAGVMWAAVVVHHVMDYIPWESFVHGEPMDLREPWMQNLIAAVALTVLATVARPAQARRSWWWLAALFAVAAVPLVPDLLPEGIDVPDAVIMVVLAGLGALAAGWTFVDPRIGVAATWWLAGTVIVVGGTVPVYWDLIGLRAYGQAAVVIAALAVVACGGAVARRRVARL
ncbi:hypothetical protein [Krasilnikovia sp. MM14-A1259]|uniref:hypothetical protein n=1 Tax=Krasilnikovia sp. MM14-A1259 TaxID=3373539 RepID=UPI00382FA715